MSRKQDAATRQTYSNTPVLNNICFESVIALFERTYQKQENKEKATTATVLSEHLTTLLSDIRYSVSTKFGSVNALKQFQESRIKNNAYYKRLAVCLQVCNEAAADACTKEDCAACEKIHKGSVSDKATNSSPDGSMRSDGGTEACAITFDTISLQFDVARQLYFEVFRAEATDLMKSNPAAQKLFLKVFFPIVFNPSVTLPVSSTVDVLFADEELRSLALLDGNRKSIRRAIVPTEEQLETFREEMWLTEKSENSGSLEFIFSAMKTAKDYLHNFMSGLSNSQVLPEKGTFCEKEADGTAFELFTKPHPEDEVDYGSIDLTLINEDEICMMCQFRLAFKEDPDYFIESYEKALDEERKSAGPEVQKLIDFYRLTYNMEVSLTACINLLTDAKSAVAQIQQKSSTSAAVDETGLAIKA